MGISFLSEFNSIHPVPRDRVACPPSPTIVLYLRNTFLELINVTTRYYHLDPIQPILRSKVAMAA